MTHIIVGISGGVDSAVAALLAHRAGHRVSGLFMKNWDADDGDQCSAADDLRSAKEVCTTLGIPLHKVSFSEQYWDRVFAHFLAEYRAGRTPNPDVLCNREIKFDAFLAHAKALGAEAIATGHYVRRAYLDGRWWLRTGHDPAKDQSYFLYLVGAQALAQSRFPIGHLSKDEVRTLARQAGLPNHARKDSTGICFIGERRFREFLARYLPAKPGPIVTINGDTIGEHLGVMYYTIGQRQGLGIGGINGYPDAPWFVVDKDVATNRLIVAQGTDHPSLYAQALNVEQVHWITAAPSRWPLRCEARIRYRQPRQWATLAVTADGGLEARFDAAQRAITPGQSIVFYHGEYCLGGGIIEGATQASTAARATTGATTDNHESADH